LLAPVSLYVAIGYVDEAQRILQRILPRLMRDLSLETTSECMTLASQQQLHLAVRILEHLDLASNLAIQASHTTCCIFHEVLRLKAAARMHQAEPPYSRKVNDSRMYR
jgi:hypothetical protein